MVLFKMLGFLNAVLFHRKYHYFQFLFPGYITFFYKEKKIYELTRIKKKRLLLCRDKFAIICDGK